MTIAKGVRDTEKLARGERGKPIEHKNQRKRKCLQPMGRDRTVAGALPPELATIRKEAQT